MIERPPGLLPTEPAPGRDPRDGTAGAHPRRLLALLVGVGTAGTLAVLTGLLQLDADVAQLGPAFWLLCGLLLLSEARPLFTAGTRDPVGLVLSTTFVFAVLLRYGLPAALVLQALSTLLADVLARKAPLRTWFNVGQYALSWTAAAGVLHLLGHRASLDRPLDLTSGDLLAAACGGLTYFLVNGLLVDSAISALTGRGLLAVAREDLGFEVLTTVALLALSPLVCLAVERGAAFVPLLLPPLLAVYAVAAVALARERAALTDALTGLPNRTALAERAAATLAEGPAALVLLDLDRFKEVNDTLGHHVGDRLLQVVAQRLATGVRGCDTVARLGGDEFALLLPGLDSAGTAVEAVERLCAAVAAPVALEGLPLEVGATAGVALAPLHGAGLEDLLRRADVAMYAGKASRQVEVYDPARDQHSPDRLALAGELRRALQGEDVAVRYQPVLDLAGGGVRRVQAVVHWHHPVRGPVPPDEVVALAARAGLATALVARVLDLALGQLADWDRQGRPLQVAVEVGAGLTGPAAAEEVGALLRRHGLDGARLQLQLDGRSPFTVGRLPQAVSRLRELGVVLAISHVGAGGADDLRRLPVAELVLDGTLVGELTDPTGPVGEVLVRSLLGLARDLGLPAGADGVDDAATARRLEELGCRSVRGGIAPPVPARELLLRLQHLRV